jgi:hypothetical protein
VLNAANHRLPGTKIRIFFCKKREISWLGHWK